MARGNPKVKSCFRKARKSCPGNMRAGNTKACFREKFRACYKG